MYSLCTNCSKIIFIQFRPLLDNLYLGIGLLIGGTVVLIRNSNSIGEYPLAAILMVIFFGYGILNIANALRRSHYCPDCKAQGALLAIDAPEAQQIIKEKNLSLPE